MMNEAVHSIMSTELITVSPSHNLVQVRKIFMSKKIHHLPVVKGKKLVGMLTTYDLWKNEISPADYQTTLVSEVMTNQVATLGSNDKIGTAAEIFLGQRFHALPIVNEEDELLGIITTFDVLLYEFGKEYPEPILYKDLFNKQKKGKVAVAK